MVTKQNVFIDFNSVSCYFGALYKGAPNEYRQNRFFSSDGILAFVRIPQMRQALSWRLQGQKFFLHGSIFMSCLRTTDLPGKLARYRSVPAFHAEQVIPHGHSRTRFTQHVIKREQPEGLAHLC